ncbi:helix-turn-helix domain-containing protein [Paenibacillus sp. F411]|uniref:AraC family transcriptional regulator n=1 Tax=Paenibacillus sp. F411 TaxID=2820239 RepID=UPI001AAEA28B|nr:AraC family transcriptional regulator [Paenibacillus sp. F411]MBO2942424.1 helix-turn-helix domain-containing protein [Paenibacillus sp. F411]
MNVNTNFFYQTVRQSHENIPDHSHQCYELVYYFNGSGLSRIGETTHRYHRGQFAFIYPHTRHSEFHFEDTEVIFFGFTCSGLPQFQLPPEGIYRDNYKCTFLPIIQEITLEMDRQRPHYRQMIDVLVHKTILQLGRLAGQDGTQPHHDALSFARAYIDEHVTQKVDIAALARQTGYSYDRFRHLFKEQTGASPGRYILNRRLALAQQLLQMSQRPICEIAHDCGFSHDSQFCSLFKRETGYTPKQYRDKTKNHVQA